jgi:hypothetical protein
MRPSAYCAASQLAENHGYSLTAIEEGNVPR